GHSVDCHHLLAGDGADFLEISVRRGTTADSRLQTRRFLFPVKFSCRPTSSMMRLFALSSLSTALIVLTFLTRRLWRNLRFLHHTRELPSCPTSPPRVSVLIPARNEARNIVPCIESLVCQRYPQFEVIALDDQSADETGALLDALAAQHTNLTVLHGTEEPSAGWNGKSYAC